MRFKVLGPLQVLRDGDVISIDCGAILDGWHGDSAISVGVGEIDPADQAMLAACESAMWAGITQAAPGKRLPLDIGMSQGELALLLGASRPKINEALGKLEETGAIGRTLDRIFCDPVKLAEVDGSHA